MGSTNLNRTTNSFDENLNENSNDMGSVQQGSNTHVSGASAKTGGQVLGGVVAQSGNRVQAENQEGTESSQGD